MQRSFAWLKQIFWRDPKGVRNLDQEIERLANLSPHLLDDIGADSRDLQHRSEELSTGESSSQTVRLCPTQPVFAARALFEVK